MKKIVVLVSGGLDSYLAYRHYKDKGTQDEIIPLFIAYPHTSNIEREAVEELFKDELYVVEAYGESTLDLRDEFIPNRNLTFASLATTFHNPDCIVLGGLKDDMVVDKSKKSFKEMSKILSKFAKKRVKVVSPFWSKTKADIINDFIKTNPEDVNMLYKTYSCYNPTTIGDRHCHKCKACFRKFIAFQSNNLDFGFDDKKLITEYLTKAKNGFYVKSRNKAIVRVLEK